MKKSSLSEMLKETTVIEQKQLIGTKWTCWCDEYRDQMSVEFVDNTHCVYTSQPKKFSMTYTVTEGKLLISEIEGAFVLRGNILFNNGLPAFEKAA